MIETGATPHPTGSAFLLAQLGGHAAERFAERIAAQDLTPAQAGVLRLVGREPALSQRDLAARLGASPSRVVALVDGLEHRSLLSRTRSEHDRRVHELRLTADGQRVLSVLAAVARAHDDEICGALDPEERHQLRDLLGKVADSLGFVPGVHPGYRHL